MNKLIRLEVKSMIILKTILIKRKKKHSYEEDSKLHVKLYYLQKRDRHFSKVAKKSLKVFEHWLFFHWILYIVASFLSLSLFLEAIIHYIDSSLPSQRRVTTGIDFHPLKIIFLGLFSASNCLFFLLYPFIRAAKLLMLVPAKFVTSIKSMLLTASTLLPNSRICL